MPNFEPTNKHDGMKALTDWMIVADEYFRTGNRNPIRWPPVFTIGGECHGATLQTRDWSSVRNGLLAWIDVIDGLDDATASPPESQG